MRRWDRGHGDAPPRSAPIAGGPAGTGTRIGSSARLAKARAGELSNRGAAPPARRGRGALAALVGVVVLVVAGLAWMGWRGTGEGRGGRAPAPPEEARDEAPQRGPAEIVAADVPRSEAAPTVSGDVELEPFEGARAPAAEATGPGSIRGQVTVSGEEPFPLAWQLVLAPSATLPRRERALARTLEFADGRADFEVRELPLGGYDVSAQAEGFNGQVLPVLLEPGSEHPFVNLRMVPAGTLEGRVLDAGSAPAEGIAVTLFPVDGAPARAARSGADGVFRFEKVPDGAYELLLGAADAPILPERHPVRFLAPRLTFPDLVLPPLGEIHVRVVDSFERPLEGVEVRGSGTNGGLVEGKTDFDGRLVAKHLPAGHFRMRLSHPGFEKRFEKRIAVDVVAGAIAEAPVRYGP